MTEGRSQRLKKNSSSPTEDLSDPSLVRRVADRDDSAMQLVFNGHFAEVFTICKKICQQPTEAEEVAARVFVEFWEFPDRFDPKRGSLRTYLCVLARSRSIDWIRKTTKREQRRESCAPELKAAAVEKGVAFDPAVNAEVEDDRNQVQMVLESLKPDFREVLKLTFVQSLTHREIAEKLRLPLGTVKSRIRRAMLAFGDRFDTVLTGTNRSDTDEL